MKEKREEKREEKKDDNGWIKYDDSVRDRTVLLTDKTDKEGIAAYWRRGRKYNKELRRYEDVSYWADLLLSNPIGFTPKFYKER